MHIPKKDIPLEVIDLLANPHDRERLAKAWLEQFYATPQVVFHEAYHFLQGLRLPFLYRYALFSFWTIYRAFRRLAVNPDLHNWVCELPGLDYLNRPTRVWNRPEKDLYVGDESNVNALGQGEPSLELTPLDLLEGAASLAEFQASTVEPSLIDPIAFDLWTKRNRSYTKAFQYVASILEDEQLALRIFLPLVNTAFHTTRPVRAFIMLLDNFRARQNNADMKTFVVQPEPCRWFELFSRMLNKLEFEAPPDSCGDKIANAPFCKLTLNEWVFSSLGQFGDRDIAHPFLTYPARKWIERENDNPVYSWLLHAPGWAKDNVLRAIQDFEAVLTFARFYIDAGQDRVIILGNEEYLKDFPFPLVDLMTIYSTARRAGGVHFDSDCRLCHHVGCPEYGPNFCNCYPLIPVHFAECTFRKRFEDVRIQIGQTNGTRENKT
jgi:hypothetical protein